MFRARCLHWRVKTMKTFEKAALVLAETMATNSWAGSRVASAYDKLVEAIEMGDRWTVLVMRPDTMWEGSVRDWTYQAHVIAPDVTGAEEAARRQAAAADDYDEPFDYAILAVYAGHLSDVVDTG